QHLDDADIGAALQKMGSKAMPEHMNRDVLGEAPLPSPIDRRREAPSDRSDVWSRLRGGLCTTQIHSHGRPSAPQPPLPPSGLVQSQESDPQRIGITAR